VRRVLQTLTELRAENGLPHRVVVDEAHYFLQEAKDAGPDPLEGYTWITYRASSLHPDVLASAECAVITRETDEAEVRALHALWGREEDVGLWIETLRDLDLDEAVLLPVGEESRDELRRFRLAPRLTHHVRHRHKYMDVPVGADQAFRFVRDDGRSGPTVASLQELADALLDVPSEALRGHVARGDFSLWIEGVFRDAALAERVRELEQRHDQGQLPDFNGAVIHAVQERYDTDGPLL
jgi:hypothetical protein